jgi:hypothetical protein
MLIFKFLKSWNNYILIGNYSSTSKMETAAWWSLGRLRFVASPGQKVCKTPSQPTKAAHGGPP